MKKTLVINYSNMRTGGVETMLAYLIKFAQEHQIRVIWITSTYLYPLASFKDIVDYNRIESIILKPWQINLMVKPKINVAVDEDVVMFSTTPLRYINFENYRRILNVHSFQHFLCLPNFKGDDYFPDQYFKSNLIQKFVYKYLSSVIQKIDDNDALRGFSDKHLYTYENYYGLNIKNIDSKLLGGNRPDISVSNEDLFQKARSRIDEFKIITCSRFEFPHKGYLIGLLNVFSDLYMTYPHISLTIIGYGEGLKQMEDLISSFPMRIAEHIHFTGMLSHSETLSLIQQSHLFVGLAGASWDAARCGTATLIVRHYSYSCETYGFFHNACDYTLSCDEGDDVRIFISDVINMTDDQYVDNCMMTKQKITEKEEGRHSPSYLFEQNDQNQCLTKSEIRKAFLINLIHWTKLPFHRLRVKLHKKFNTEEMLF